MNEFMVKLLLQSGMAYTMIQLALTYVAKEIRKKDDNTTGADDALANVIDASVPVVAAVEDWQATGDVKLLRKALVTVWIILGGYLGYDVSQATKKKTNT